MLARLLPLFITLFLTATPPLIVAQNVDQLFEQGNAAQNAGKYTEAEGIFRQIIKIDSNNADAYIFLGNALYYQGKLDEAIAAYNKALSLPDQQGTRGSAHAFAHNGLGSALQQQGKIEQAIAEYEKSLKIDPNFIYAQNNLKEAQRLLALKTNPIPSTVDEQKYIPSETDEPLVKELRSTARIIAQVSAEGYSIGAGWVVKRSGDTVWIVTNRHVISDRKTKRLATQIEIEFFSELSDTQRPRYKKVIIEQATEPDESLDIAVLKVSGIPADIQPLALHVGRISRKTAVTIIGHPHTVEDPWNSSSGEVMNFSPNRSTLPISANHIAEGNSGGPVINEQKQIVAMMVIIRRPEDVAIAFDPNQPTPELDDVPPATSEVGIAYRIDIIVEKLTVWGILP